MISFIRKHPVGIGAGTLVLVAGLAWLAFGFFGIHTLFVDDVVDEAGPVFDADGTADAAEVGNTTDRARVVAPTGTLDTDTDTDTDTDSVAPASSPSSAPEVPETVTSVEPAGPTGAPPTTEPPAPDIVTEYRGTFESDAHPTSGDAVVLGNGTGQRFLRFENFATDNGPDLNVYLVDSSTGDVSDYVDLGDLTGNIGDQNYEIPVDVDLSVYDEVVIWCVRFGVGFGDARLAPA